VTSDADALKKFVENLQKALTAAKLDQTSLIVLLLEFSLDNAVMDIAAAGQLSVTYSYSVSIQVTQVTTETTVEQVTDSPAQTGSTKHQSIVTISGSFSEDLSPLLKQFADKLVSAKVMESDCGANVLTTFGVAGGTAVSVADIPQLVINGDSDAKARFITSMSSLANTRAQNEAGFDMTTIVKLLLELLLDNSGVPAQNAAQLCATNGVSISIQETTVAIGSQATAS